MILDGAELRPRLVDLFCGIGLGAAGFVKSGFEIAAAVDIDSEACEIYRKNIGVAPMVGDLREISGHQILDKIGLKRGELDACSGCPPCQGFSSLRRTRLRKHQRDTRKALLRVFASRVDELLPKVILLENVKGLTFDPNRRFLNEFISHMQRLGYKCAYEVVDASDFGVPQSRKRLILIGSRNRVPSLPPPTHSDSGDGKPRKSTVRSAIFDLRPLNAGEKDPNDPLHEATDHSETALKIIRSIPHDGGSRRSLPRDLWLPCHRRLAKAKQRGAESIYGRMSWDKPSPTITTRSCTPSCGRFLHPVQDRGITLREAIRLQTAPDDFYIAGTKDKMGRWIGNGFPPMLTELLGQRAQLYV